jgi:hypothetical protein
MAKPVIIFEYNHVTKEHFKLEEVESELGNEYRLYGLNSKGKLDNNFNNTWNLVALHSSQPFSGELFA